eukprot:2740786-Amphidinium_carterae.1
MSEDRDAYTNTPHTNRDNPGTFNELQNKVQVVARMAFQIYEKQKNCQTEYDLLLEKCDKLEKDLKKSQEDLKQSQREMNIWIDLSCA